MFLLTFLILLSTIQYITINSLTSDENTLVIQLENEIENIDNRWRNIGIEDTQVAYQYQGYLGQIAPGETIYTMPGIAESWTKNENGTKWVFTLREGLTFHDGSPINARAVKYSIYASWMAYYQLDNLSESLSYHRINVTFPDYDPEGNGRVVIFQGDWFPDPMFEYDICGMWKVFTLVPYGSHGLYSDSTQVCQDKYTLFMENPISAGPYMFKEWIKGEYVLLERFDDWFGWGQSFTASNGKTYTFPRVDQAFKYIKYRFISEIDVALMDLRAGDVDVTTGKFSSIASLYHINNTEGYTTYMLPHLGGATMHMNIQGDWPTIYGGPGNFPVSQDWFRKAISHAINRTNIVENSYAGIAYERNTIFPDWILEEFTNLDTSDYYDFDQGLSEAEALLNAAGYTPLGFPDEPDNRFGWGLYANETDIDGVPQIKGRHFILITRDSDFYVKKALAIQKDLKQIGIYIDTELLERSEYITALYEGTAGLSYNATYTDSPDPEFEGPYWDFTVSDFYSYYDIPWGFIVSQSFAFWMFYGYGPYSWYNVNYEVGYAMATGGMPGWGYVPGAPTDVYPVPEWSNDDPQFIEGCRLAGYEMSHAMNRVPLIFYADTYAFNDNIQNFIVSRDGRYRVAYSYPNDRTSSHISTNMTTVEPTSSSLEPTSSSEPPSLNVTNGFSVFVILFAVASLVYRHKRR